MAEKPHYLGHMVVKGTVDRSTVYPRKVLETALQNKAYAVVLTHNHPNGNPEPSEQDKNVISGFIVQ